MRAVVVRGAGERGLCAGGDIVAIYHSVHTDGGAEARQFWHDEYVLNHYIARYPKPYVALMDGIVMGGGVGVGVHAGTRVVTDTSKVAMPEVGIGFVPDVGGTYYLSRAPGNLGLHAALTGAPFSGSDAIAMGFADHYVPHQALDDFAQAIVDDGLEAAVKSHSVAPPSSNLFAQRSWIDDCYAGDTVADIVAALRGHDAGPANDAANLIATRSPTSLAVALAAVRRARSARHAGRCSAPRVSGIVRDVALPRSGGGHPRASHRQGPRPQVVALLTVSGQRSRRRGVLRARRE